MAFKAEIEKLTNGSIRDWGYRQRYIYAAVLSESKHLVRVWTVYTYRRNVTHHLATLSAPKPVVAKSERGGTNPRISILIPSPTNLGLHGKLAQQHGSHVFSYILLVYHMFNYIVQLVSPLDLICKGETCQIFSVRSTIHYPFSEQVDRQAYH